MQHFGCLAYHSALILAPRITRPHFTVSSAMNLSNSADDIGVTSAPSSAKRSLSLGSPSAPLISLLSLAMISAGVFLGTPTPDQEVTSKPGTKSAMSGTSG